MPASKAQQKAVSKYMKENYDVFQIRMPKGRKDNVKGVAAATGESLNQYIISAINQRMERDSGRDAPTGPQEAPVMPPEAGTVSPSDTLKTAQEAAGEALPVFVARAVETQAERDKITRKMRGGG